MKYMQFLEQDNRFGGEMPINFAADLILFTQFSVAFYACHYYATKMEFHDMRLWGIV